MTAQLSLPFAHAQALEHFFGWGENEILLEVLERAVYKAAILNVSER